jgi:hypothetical protein
MLLYFRKTVMNLSMLCYCVVAGLPEIPELSVEDGFTFFIAAIDFINNSY